MTRTALCAVVLAALCAATSAAAQSLLPAPGFHHLHLNSTNPDAAIAFYVQQFPSTSKTSWGGVSALASPNNVLVLFNRVNAAPAADPEASALWHFGWHVTDVRKNLQTYQGRPGVTLAPLYTGEANNSVFVSSDTWPGTGGVLGLTQMQIADAKVRQMQPLRGAGFAYMRGPDNALIEYQGNFPAERFNHVHLYQEDPFCAQLWYRRHLNAALPPNAQPRTESDCKIARGPDKTWPALNREGMFRTPIAGVIFGDVSVNWYMRQRDVALQPTAADGSRRAQRCQSGCVGREAQDRERAFPGAGIPARRHARRDDRRAEPRSDRARRNQVASY